jgi:5'-nucleotidase
MNVDLPDWHVLQPQLPELRAQADLCRGVEVTSQGKLDFGLTIDERADGRGLPYYWLRFGERLGDVPRRAPISTP